MFFTPDKYDLELRQPVAWKKPFPFLVSIIGLFLSMAISGVAQH